MVGRAPQDPADIALRVLGQPERLMALSKSRYRELRPNNLAVFNARLVSTAAGQALEELWSGDIDLTLWEQRLAAVARLIDRPLLVLYEGDRSTSAERATKQAIVTFNSRGELLIPESRQSYVTRDSDGLLRLVLPRDRAGRFNWRLLLHRPQLWRFWKVEVVKQGEGHPPSEKWRLIYLGLRGGDAPMLVLGLTRQGKRKEAIRSIEWTWYPGSRRRKLAAANTLIHLTPSIAGRRWKLRLNLVVWPGLSYELYGGVTRKDS